jgi:hypothetical protein
MKPSVSAPVFLYGSGHSYNFPEKLLGVDIPLFLFNTQFYFPFLHKSHKSKHTYIATHIVQLVVCFPTMQAAGV